MRLTGSLAAYDVISRNLRQVGSAPLDDVNRHPCPGRRHSWRAHSGCQNSGWSGSVLSYGSSLSFRVISQKSFTWPTRPHSCGPVAVQLEASTLRLVM
jgi:hypothetical protein